jgi:hypothetical protein
MRLIISRTENKVCSKYTFVSTRMVLRFSQTVVSQPFGGNFPIAMGNDRFVNRNARISLMIHGWQD